MNKILVVEDEELIRTMITLNLERAGYEVHSCETADKMLILMENNSFDLVLLDIMLPGMSGEQALRVIRDRDIQTPVIMVTAKNSIETKVNSLECGADDYISKPFDIKELQARIKAIIRRNLIGQTEK